MPSVFARPNKFDLSHTNALTCDMGVLVPFYTQEVLPGDEFRIRTDCMVRLAPMLTPIFGEIDVYTHYFLYLIGYYGEIGKNLLLMVWKLEQTVLLNLIGK